MLQRNNKDKHILKYIQYKFPITPNPYREIAESLNMNVESLIKKLREFRELGIIKRIGFTFNYRVHGLVSSLVGFNLEPNKINRFSKKLNRLDNVKHNYLRKHERFNIWFTIKTRSDKETIDAVATLADEFNVQDHIILKSVKTYKLSVKYNLSEGISWSEFIPRDLDGNIDMGIHGLNKQIISSLRKIPIREEPYKEIMNKTGYTEDEIIEAVNQLMKEGVIYDFGAVLDGEKLGFKYNAMVTFKGDPDHCRELIKTAREATHIVLRRSIFGEWDKNIYYVIHGTNKDIVEERIGRIMNNIGVDKYLVIYSLKNLKRGGY